MKTAKCGGLSDVKAVDGEIQGICDKVKSSIGEKLGCDSPQCTAMSYKTQVVSGTNYFVKIYVDGENYIHARIFQPLPHTGKGPELHSIQMEKELEDEIEYF